MRGLNWPNKQEDLKLFIHSHGIGIAALLETKIKEKNVHAITNKLLPNWHWYHNFDLNSRGRILVGYNPKMYHLIELDKAQQAMHFKVVNNHTQKQFVVTVVYGFNTIEERHSLWEFLLYQASMISEAWCVMGDFNSILYQKDRIGGTQIKQYEIDDFATCLENCDLQELPFNGPYYTWTNKTVWSRIDRFVTNPLWHITHDYTEVSYKANSLSDHNPIVINFRTPPKPSPKQYVAL